MFFQTSVSAKVCSFYFFTHCQNDEKCFAVKSAYLQKKPQRLFGGYFPRFYGKGHRYSVDALQKHLADNGILGGVKVADDIIMFAVTEKRTKEEIDQLVELVK